MWRGVADWLSLKGTSVFLSLGFVLSKETSGDEVGAFQSHRTNGCSFFFHAAEWLGKQKLRNIFP